MRRLLLALALVASLHAAGNVQQSFQQLGTSNNYVLAVNWTGDSVTGSVPATLANVSPVVQGYRIFAVEVAPGSPAPTNLYSVTLTTSGSGSDMLAGTGASLSNTTAAQLQTPSFAVPVNGTVTINVTGNSVGGAKGVILIYFAPIAQIHGLIPNGPGFPTNNTFTGTNTFTGPVNTCRFNNIRIVDGTCFTQNAAGINAADADLGTANGEIWVPPGSTITATDAQISIRAGHTLKVFGGIFIDASASHGPILLGDGARLTCAGPAGAANGQITQVPGSTSLTSMVRLTAQDGSQASGIAIDSCQFYANASTVSNGVLDVSGSVNRGYVRDTRISGYTSGFGIFIQDIQSGALAGTSNLQIMNNQISANGTAGCILINHTSTNAVSINHIDIQDTNCSPGASLGNAAVLIQNQSTSPTLFGHINISHMTFQGSTNNQTALAYAGVQAGYARGIWCNIGGTGVCVAISNSANNQFLVFDSIFSFTGTLTDSVNSITLPTQYVSHYEMPNNSTAWGYFNAVSYLKVQGLAPTSATGTGFGTGATFTFNAGSTNNAGVIFVSTGTGPASNGTLTLNFNTTQSSFGVNFPSCVFELGNNNNAWNARATVISGALSTSSVVENWDNNAVALAASAGSGYAFSYWCGAK